jgi:hypothetical protein
MSVVAALFFIINILYGGVAQRVEVRIQQKNIEKTT